MTESDSTQAIEYNRVESKLKQYFQSETKLEVVCVYSILLRENYISTKRLIDLAISHKQVKNCVGCASADSVFRAIKKLQCAGLIMGHMKKGGYVWELILD
ncbi:MAG: hypothetical protein ACTSO7_01245 [Candidatus Heimdallarchaeota archaeon]